MSTHGPGDVLDSLITSAPIRVGGDPCPGGGIREAPVSGGAGLQDSEVFCCRRGTGAWSPPSSRGGGGLPTKPAKEPAELCLSQSGGRGGMAAGSRSGSQARGRTQLPSAPLWGGQGRIVDRVALSLPGRGVAGQEHGSTVLAARACCDARERWTTDLLGFHSSRGDRQR